MNKFDRQIEQLLTNGRTERSKMDSMQGEISKGLPREV